MKHTQGKWEVVGTKDRPQFSPMRKDFLIGTDDKVVCLTMLPLEDEENEANAKLIAAAPELLEASYIAVRNMKKWIEGGFNKSECEIIYQMIESEIKKAQ